MKIRQDNYVTNHTGTYYKNNTELSCPIGPGTIYDEN